MAALVTEYRFCDLHILNHIVDTVTSCTDYVNRVSDCDNVDSEYTQHYTCRYKTVLLTLILYFRVGVTITHHYMGKHCCSQ